MLPYSSMNCGAHGANRPPAQLQFSHLCRQSLGLIINSTGLGLFYVSSRLAMQIETKQFLFSVRKEQMIVVVRNSDVLDLIL